MISKLHVKRKIIIGSKATRHPSGAGACARLCQHFLAITFRMDGWLERQKDNIHKHRTRKRQSKRDAPRMEEVSNSDGKMLEGNSQQEMSKREDDNDWQEKDEPQRPWKQGWQRSGGGKRDSRGSAPWVPREWRDEDGDPKRQRIDERWGDETSTWHNGRWGSWNDDKQQRETKYVFTVSQQGSNEFEITGTPDAVKKKQKT